MEKTIKCIRGNVREILTFVNLRNKGTIPDRNKEKGRRQATETVTSCE